jgi:hypothetical protein
VGNDDDVKEDEGVVEGENLLCHSDDGLAQAWMARKDGRSTGWACKGRTQSAWGENLRYRLLASHFYFASATAGTGWFAEGGDECGDANVVGIRLGWGRKGRRMMDGFGKVWTLAAMVRRRASVHLFCLHAAKESGRAVDL